MQLPLYVLKKCISQTIFNYIKLFSESNAMCKERSQQELHKHLHLQTNSCKYDDTRHEEL